MKDKITIIIPSLNPDNKLLLVVDSLIEAGFTDIVLVNDGSDEAHKEPFEKAAQYEQCTILTHEVNKGKGRALKTAFEYVYNNRKDSVGVVTVDGDNQHKADDITACLNKMVELEDRVILGCRDFSGSDVPARSRFGNNMTKFVFKFACGLNISDTQTGLRAIPYKYLDDFSKIKGERFEYETNMLLELKDKDIPYDEVKIKTVYIEENASSHFNPLVDSLKIYKVIFKFVLSSLMSSVIDLVMFAVLIILIGNTLEDTMKTTVAGVMARVISSLFNFFVNQKAVFKTKVSMKLTIIRYYILCIIQMLASLSLVAIAITVFSIETEGIMTLVKAIIDTLLFLISFQIQRKWVFRK